jgi:hypothetical protein
VLERATDLLAVAPLERAIPVTRRRVPPVIGERIGPRRVVAIPIDPGPNHSMRAPWGEPDDPVPFVTIVTRRWPVDKPVPGRRGGERAGAIAEAVAEPVARETSRDVRRRHSTRPARRRLITRLAMVGLALIASLVAAELAGRGRPTIGSSRA